MHNFSKLESDGATRHLKLSVTLASRFTEHSSFSIEVFHILFISNLVTVKLYKKKKKNIAQNSDKLENNNATGH